MHCGCLQIEYKRVFEPKRLNVTRGEERGEERKA
jgi:hypothetical protein